MGEILNAFSLFQVKYKKIVAFFAVFMLFFSLKGFILCVEGGEDYILEFKYSPCCYEVHKNEISDSFLERSGLSVKAETCIDYDLSQYSHFTVRKVFRNITNICKRTNSRTEKYFFVSKPNLFLTKFKFINLPQKIISTTILII